MDQQRTGVILGTPVYMSPEQCRGVGEIDHRTYIYSLGCILFEMICGTSPFTSEGFGELIHSHLSITPPRLRSFDPGIPAAVDDLVARILSKARRNGDLGTKAGGQDVISANDAARPAA